MPATRCDNTGTRRPTVSSFRNFSQGHAMTILNTASDGFFNVLIVLHRTLATHGPMDEERLIRLCSPGPDQRYHQASPNPAPLDTVRAVQDDGERQYSHSTGWTKTPSDCRRSAGSCCSAMRITRASGITRARARQISRVPWRSFWLKTSTPTSSVPTLKVQALEQRQIRRRGSTGFFRMTCAGMA